MGATASMSSPVNVCFLSSQEVGALAASIGPVYIPYAQLFIDEGITGVFLSSKDEAGFKKVLEEIGVTRELHRDNIYTLFMSLKDAAQAPSGPPPPNPAPPPPTGPDPRLPPTTHVALFPAGYALLTRVKTTTSLALPLASPHIEAYACPPRDGLDLGLEGALAALRMPTLGPADAEAALKVRGGWPAWTACPLLTSNHPPPSLTLFLPPFLTSSLPPFLPSSLPPFLPSSLPPLPS